jgi:hypothetical protein
VPPLSTTDLPPKKKNLLTPFQKAVRSLAINGPVEETFCPVGGFDADPRLLDWKLTVDDETWMAGYALTTTEVTIP